MTICRIDPVRRLGGSNGTPASDRQRRPVFRRLSLVENDATASHFRGIQVKTLSKHGAVALGTKGLDNLLGHWWIIVNKVATKPECFIMKPAEVRKRAVRDKHKARAYWLPAKQYNTAKFREAWDRIGRGDAS